MKCQHSTFYCCAVTRYCWQFAAWSCASLKFISAKFWTDMWSCYISQWEEYFVLRLCLSVAWLISNLRDESSPLCWSIIQSEKILNIWSEHNYIFSYRLVHTTTCFGPVYWPSSGCIINFISSYTICAWVTLWGTRFRLTVVGGMASGSPWAGVKVICQCLSVLFQTCWSLD
jgi:hypothetical protein